MKKITEGILFFVMGLVFGGALGVSLMLIGQTAKDVNVEERRNEILSMDPGDVVDSYFPSLRQTIGETTDELLRDLISITLREVGRTIQDQVREGAIIIVGEDNSRISTED